MYRLATTGSNISLHSSVVSAKQDNFSIFSKQHLVNIEHSSPFAKRLPFPTVRFGNYSKRKGLFYFLIM